MPALLQHIVIYDHRSVDRDTRGRKAAAAAADRRVGTSAACWCQHAVCHASEAGVGAPATRVQVGVCTDGVLRAARPRQPVVPKVLG